MIKLDVTRYSVVVQCDQCPWWYGFADSRLEGWRVGAGHETRAHPDRDQARHVIDQRHHLARHAERNGARM